jgi:hypothetical protein
VIGYVPPPEGGSADPMPWPGLRSRDFLRLPGTHMPRLLRRTPQLDQDAWGRSPLSP